MIASWIPCLRNNHFWMKENGSKRQLSPQWKHTIEIHNCSDLTLSVLVLLTHLLQGHLCFRGRMPGCWGLTPSHSQIYRVLNLTKLYHMLVVPPPCWGSLTFFFHCCNFSSSSSSSPLFSNLVLFPSSNSLLLFPSSFCAASFCFCWSSTSSSVMHELYGRGQSFASYWLSLVTRTTQMDHC